MDKDKQEFLNEFGHVYGYPNGPKSIDQIRSTEFKRLGDLVYLDHAGATLYSELQMEAVFKDLTTGVYGNPHSQSDSSNASCDVIREARQQVLEYFNASPKDYKCIFTSGATGALKLVGEAFPWSQESLFMYTMENHNSVLGIREYALDRGATAVAIDMEVPLDDQGISRSTLTKMSKHTMQQRNLGGDCGELEEKSLVNANNLFAFPSECNFSGAKFSLEMVNIIKEQPERILEHSPFSKGNWFVLIDAAKGCVTEPPDLSKYPADFVVLSFYKLFGYPTGLGALIAKNDSAKLLRKTYFSGGTVSASIADVDFVKRREAVEEMFEDGTASYLSIASIRHGFRILSALSTCAMSQHMTSLAKYVREILSSLKHSNGARVCMLYGSHSSKNIGSIVTFNLRRPDGSWYGYHEVEKLASLSGIQLRTGCFCNPGACAKFLGLSHLDIKSNVEAGHVCWDDKDIIHGKPTGAVRISFGYMSTYEDAKRFIDLVTNYFVSSSNQSGSDCQLTRSIPSMNEGPLTNHSAASYLKSILVYPIKSCAGFAVDRWPLGSCGLQYDREWVLRSLTGVILTQKKVPNLRLINTFIDLNQDILCVESPHCREKLKIDISSSFYYGGMQEIDMQAQRYEVLTYNDEVNCWFSSIVGHPCALLRLSKPKYNGPVCRDLASKLNFANTAEFLLISEASVSDLNKRLSSNVQKGLLKEAIQVNPMRFRPNLVISGGEPYAEDGWTILRIGKLFFRSLGGCNRCHMINLNNDSELQKSREPLATLASYRRAKGKILFGILLGFEPDDNEAQDSKHWINVGEEVNPDTE